MLIQSAPMQQYIVSEPLDGNLHDEYRRDHELGRGNLRDGMSDTNLVTNAVSMLFRIAGNNMSSTI